MVKHEEVVFFVYTIPCGNNLDQLFDNFVENSLKPGGFYSSFCRPDLGFIPSQGLSVRFVRR